MNVISIKIRRRFFLFLICLCYSWACFSQVKFTDGKEAWDADKLGNHRVVVECPAGIGQSAKVEAPWRRRDEKPWEKGVIVTDAVGTIIKNVAAEKITREIGVILFEPTRGKGIYYLYYMPYIDEGPKSHYPKGLYQKQENITEQEIAKLKNKPSDCRVVEIQSLNNFNSFDPMEVIATRTETLALIKKRKAKTCLIFPEDREHPIRMKTDIPQRWLTSASSFHGEALVGENFTYQLGIFAIKKINDLTIIFHDLKNDNGSIPAAAMSSLNHEGVSYVGKPFRQKVALDSGRVQSLWLLLKIPPTAKVGVYKGKATVTADGNSQEVAIELVIKQGGNKDGNIAEPQKMTRLCWLNSTLAQENTVMKPYTPLVVRDTSIALLGRKVTLNKFGLPAKIETFFTQEMTSIGKQPQAILANPFQFHALDLEKKELLFRCDAPTKFTKITDGTVSWESKISSNELSLNISGAMEFDGFSSYSIKVTARKDVSLSDVNLSVPFESNMARYLLGLGQKGGALSDSLQWKWDVANKNQDGAWIGGVNGGLQFSLRDENYSRPLNTNFYLQKPLVLPSSWGNDNRGGITITRLKKTIFVKAYSGLRKLKVGESLHYNFTLLITPFHPIDTDAQWEGRYFHRYQSIDSIKKIGASLINIHHATPINPYINYPFIEHEKMKAYVNEAHEKGLKVKIYNTIRELSNKAYEIQAIRSLGHELFSAGKGGGFSWLQEHLGDDYIPAWFVHSIKDAAIINSGSNRWHNYYVEGMNWLTQNVGIDGVYLDDVAFDRTTMKRIKRVLTQDNHPGIIDLHSANQFNKNDGFNNSANLYMEHFPYINRLWFGEYFDYEKNSPDFYLTEVSGIPFGLMGEMLQDGGNKWRGMLYGMTCRLPWNETQSPEEIWKFWDEYGIKGSRMIGYWSDSCPIKTDNNQILATVYQKEKGAIISIAGWASNDVKVKLQWDWKKLGIEKQKAELIAPPIKNFQVGAAFSIDGDIPIKKGEGILLVLREK